MNTKIIFILIGIALVSCHQDNSNAQQKLPNPETKAPNSQYPSAFAGQTRAPGMKSDFKYQVVILDKSLKSPWGVDNLPGGKLLISQKYGTFRIETLSGKNPVEISKGVPEVNPKGQGGLLDVAVDPNYARNRRIFWAFSEPQARGGALLAIARGNISKDETAIENTQIIYRATPAYTGTLQYGSRIVFDKKGNLFVSTGERSDKEIRGLAQSLDASIGKMVHLTPDGKPVPNGPFAKTANARPEIYAYGFRNPDGLDWNPVTGELWEAEFGPRGGDEVNIVRPGKNYGWPIITYGIEYSGQKVGDGIQQKDGMEQPIYYFDPVISPGSLTFYTGDKIPEWKNNLFLSGLSGSCLVRLSIHHDKVVGEERLLSNMGERFRRIKTGSDGNLYVVTDSGKLLRIVKQ
ncbi:MAG: PQQ-dependent sugar dehydrogenase [Chitinophagaceae bacterium]